VVEPRSGTSRQKWPKATLLMMSLTKKFFFSLQTWRLAESFEGLNSSLALSGEELCGWYVNQDIPGFFPISKYDVFRDRQPMCWRIFRKLFPCCSKTHFAMSFTFGNLVFETWFVHFFEVCFWYFNFLNQTENIIAHLVHFVFSFTNYHF